MLHQSVYPKDLEVKNVAVPSILTDVSTVDTEIFEINISNTTGGALTLLVQDKQGSPLAEIPTISIPANTLDLVVYTGVGLLSLGGVSWQASNTGLVGSMRGRKLTGWTIDSNNVLTKN